MAVPEVPKTFVEQMKEQIAALDTEKKWNEFKDTFNEKLSAVKDSLTPEQLVKIQESLEAKWEDRINVVSKSMRNSYDALKHIIDLQISVASKAKKILYSATAETTTAVGAVIGGSALGNGLDMMSNVLESIGKVASDVWEYLKPYLEKFASTPFVKFFIGEEGERKLQAWLGINPDDEKVKKEIIVRLPSNVELIPDPANKKNDSAAITRFNDSYDSLATKPASKGQFFNLLWPKLHIDHASTIERKITLTQIADAAAEYVTEQQPPIAAPAPAPSTDTTK